MCKLLKLLTLFLNSYDFDRDGYITKDDVRLILSHVPIVNQLQGNGTSEGAFTQAGGGK